MRKSEFQEFLLRSAVCVIACDGKIEESEIQEVRRMAENEIFFMGYDYEEPFGNLLKEINLNGTSFINAYLTELSKIELTENQELNLINVLIKAIESDEVVENNEIKFLQMVKSKLKISEETVISTFPAQINYLIDFNNYGLHSEFSAETILE